MQVTGAAEATAAQPPRQLASHNREELNARRAPSVTQLYIINRYYMGEARVDLFSVFCFLVIAGVVAAKVIPMVKRRNAEAEERRKKEEYENSIPTASFSVVHDPKEMLEVILQNLEVEDLRENAPLLETIYFSSVTSDSLVITAGNRTITHWNMTITAKPSRSGGTKGFITLDRARNRVLRWQSNINDTFFKVRSVVAASDVNGTYEGEMGAPLASK
ncbi:hypothetical protein [Arthrobacter sp. OV608]|uniref:hypothetical protein n=1 Tax=Arthrobacter sp. OV608 TaxID=1882768 RepID=UPI0008BCAEC5|nr:hypothetical protein [Arthrobacter sp. OV608]SEP85937.1 hypothetical protein SAMN05444745_102229 [Arthrobacter sp. OV608]